MGDAMNHPCLPTGPAPDDHAVMAGLYRLLTAYDTGAPRYYGRVVAETLASPLAAGILSALVGYAHAATVARFGVDRGAAAAHLLYELDLHRDLDNLSTADLDDTP